MHALTLFLLVWAGLSVLAGPVGAGAAVGAALAEAEDAWKVPSYKAVLRVRRGSWAGDGRASQRHWRAPVTSEKASVEGSNATMSQQPHNETRPLRITKEGTLKSSRQPSKSPKGNSMALTTKRITWPPLRPSSGGTRPPIHVKKPAALKSSRFEGPSTPPEGPQAWVAGRPFFEKGPLGRELARMQATKGSGWLLDAFFLLVKVLGFASILAFCSTVAEAEKPKEEQEQDEAFTPNETVLMLGYQLIHGSPRTIRFAHKGADLESKVILYPYPPENITTDEFNGLLITIDRKLKDFVTADPSKRRTRNFTVFGPRGSMDHLSICECRTDRKWGWR